MKAPKGEKNIFDSRTSETNAVEGLPIELQVKSLMREMEALKRRNDQLEAELQARHPVNGGMVVSQMGFAGVGIPMKSFPDSSSDKWKRGRQGTVDPKYMKLPIAKFNGKEIHPGLGGNFREWGENFVMQLNTTQDMVKQCWSEGLKIQVLGSKLEGAPLIYFNQHLGVWNANGQATLDFVMQKLDLIYSKKITVDRGMELLRKPKPASRSWKDHLVYLGAVNIAMGGGQEAAVLQALVKHAKPSMANTLGIIYNKYRTDYEVMGLEIVDRAEDEDPTSEAKVARVNSVSQRRCYNCNKPGHMARDCRSKIKDSDVNTIRDKDRSVESVFNVRQSRKKMATGQKGKEITWILDTGSSLHFVSDEGLLKELEEVTKKGIGFNESMVDINMEGKVDLESDGGGKVRITEVNYHPSVKKNLLSYAKLEEKGCIMEYCKGKKFLVNEKTREKLFKVFRRNGVLQVKTKMWSGRAPDKKNYVLNAEEDEEPKMKATLMEFHQMLGHLPYEKILKLAQNPRYGLEITDDKIRTCVACAEGKQTKNRQPTKDSGSNAPIDRIGGVTNADCKGPMTPTDRNGNRYFSLFIDYLTNVMRVFLAKTKSSASSQFGHFMAWFERSFDCRLQVLRTDGGKEFRQMDLLCEQMGIERQKSEPYNQASNGKAERAIRTVMDLARTILLASRLPITFWGDAVLYACYILNRVPTRANAGGKSPLETATGKVQFIGDLVPFGSKCTVLVSHKYGKGKRKEPWKERALAGYIIGKNEEVKGYKVYIPSKSEVVTSQHVRNIECLSEEQNNILKKFLKPTKPIGVEEQVISSSEQVSQDRVSEGDTNQYEEGSDSPEGDENEVTAEEEARLQEEWNRPSFVPRRPNEEHVELVKKNYQGRLKKSKPASKEKQTGMLTRGKSKRMNLEGQVNVIMQKDPRNFREAKNSPLWKQWQESMREEIEALNSLGTFTMIPREPNMTTLHSKWVFKTKTLPDGKIERFKSRLVACGNEQVKGENYDQTFAPTLEMTSVMMIFALAIFWGVPAKHGDVPNAFPRADTEDGLNIYMELPSGFDVMEEELRSFGVQRKRELVLKLNKSLYGLKQAGRLWNKLMDVFLIKHGYKRSVTDKCFYFKIENGEIAIVGLYVDDLLVTGSKQSMVDDFFVVASKMDIKDLGQASKFLGMRVIQDEYGISFDQETMIDDVLKKHGLENANATRLPISLNYDEVDDGELLPPRSTTEQPVSVQVYQSIVGSLLWIARCTRPDIMFAVHAVTRKTHAPSEKDLKIAKQIMRYLKGTKDLKLHMESYKCEGQNQITLSGYSDADWGDNKSTRKSVSGGIVCLNGNPVSWSCKKQSCVALSTQEAEYIAGAELCKELLGLQQVFQELNMRIKSPTFLWMDNMQGIKQIEQETSSTKLKHVDMKYKFLCERAKKGDVVPKYVKSEDQVADIFTKPMSQVKMMKLRRLCGLW
jgi:hypothetical protein